VHTGVSLLTRFRHRGRNDNRTGMTLCLSLLSGFLSCLAHSWITDHRNNSKPLAGYLTLPSTWSSTSWGCSKRFDTANIVHLLKHYKTRTYDWAARAWWREIRSQAFLLEYWSTGVMVQPPKIYRLAVFPLLQYSITPILFIQYSNTPLLHWFLLPPLRLSSLITPDSWNVNPKRKEVLHLTKTGNSEYIRNVRPRKGKFYCLQILELQMMRIGRKTRQIDFAHHRCPWRAKALVLSV